MIRETIKDIIGLAFLIGIIACFTLAMVAAGVR